MDGKKRRRATIAGGALAAAAFALAAGQPGWAALGGRLESIRADRMHLSAAGSSASAPNYSVHTLNLANGGVVREYINGEGVVFALTWRGPGRPDLRQLLGDHFSELQAANVRVGVRRSRRPLAVDHSDFIVRSGGHPGAFRGVAYLPLETPAGFSSGDLK